MKKFAVFAAAILTLGLGAARVSAEKSAAELEKEKALANPYPNDFGPDHLTDEELKDYPADKKEGYKLLLTRCAQCHTPSRPLNSRFVEPAAGLKAAAGPARDKAEYAAVAALKKGHDDLSVWQIESGVWARYVKRMLNKPGCGKAQGGQMTPADAKKIYEFLAFDGEKRKLGDNADKWKAHRLSLVEKLKKEKPARYEELKKDNDL